MSSSSIPSEPASSSSDRSPASPRIPRDVWAISFASLFADWGYEMVLPVLPFFLIYTLYTNPFVVGAIDGLAQFGQSVMSEVSGALWAQSPQRRRTAAVGYALTGLGHALIAIATAWPQVLVLRVSAWLGRGTRQPIKHAIVSNASSSEHKGKAFGLEQALDSLGAVVGTVAAIAILLWSGLAFSGAFRWIFALSAVPSAAAVTAVLVFVHDRAWRPAPTAALRGTLGPPMSRGVRWFFLAELVFGLGYYSILLALLRVGESLLPSTGGSVAFAVAASLVIYLLYNVVYTIVPYPAGHWADRMPGAGLVSLSFALFVVVDLLLVAGGDVRGGVLAFLVGASAFTVAGIQIGLQGVAELAWLSRHVPEGSAGRAFGRLGMIQGLAVLSGSLIVGGLWTYVNATVAFEVSAAFCSAGAVLAALVPQMELAGPSRGPAQEAQ